MYRLETILGKVLQGIGTCLLVLLAIVFFGILICTPPVGWIFLALIIVSQKEAQDQNHRYAEYFNQLDREKYEARKRAMLYIPEDYFPEEWIKTPGS